MADYDAISKVIRNAIRKEVDKQIELAYQRGYKAGRYVGRNEAWELAKKIEKIDVDCEYNFAFDGYLALEILQKYSASEAIAKIEEYEENQTEKSYRNNKYYNTFPTSKETADKIKAEYDEDTRSYVYTVEDEALKMMKEKSPIIQAYADVERQI